MSSARRRSSVSDLRMECEHSPADASPDPLVLFFVCVYCIASDWMWAVSLARWSPDHCRFKDDLCL